MKWLLTFLVTTLIQSHLLAGPDEDAAAALALVVRHKEKKPERKEEHRYEWRHCQDCRQVALYRDGFQIGNWWYGEKTFYELDGSGYTSGTGWMPWVYPRGRLPEGAPSPPTQQCPPAQAGTLVGAFAGGSCSSGGWGSGMARGRGRR